MTDSIEFCATCKKEYEIKYDMRDEDKIISQTRCKCFKRDINKPKILDEALLKIKGVLNGKLPERK